MFKSYNEILYDSFFVRFSAIVLLFSSCNYSSFKSCVGIYLPLEDGKNPIKCLSLRCNKSGGLFFTLF